jgi:hypothetical protein
MQHIDTRKRLRKINIYKLPSSNKPVPQNKKGFSVVSVLSAKKQRTRTLLLTHIHAANTALRSLLHAAWQSVQCLQHDNKSLCV